MWDSPPDNLTAAHSPRFEPTMNPRLRLRSFYPQRFEEFFLQLQSVNGRSGGI
jgi:hypothetical protein